MAKKKSASKPVKKSVKTPGVEALPGVKKKKPAKKAAKAVKAPPVEAVTEIKKITDVPAKVWKQVDRVREKWIKLQTKQFPDAMIKSAVAAVLAETTYKDQPIEILDSPAACCDYTTSKLKEGEQLTTYWSIWWNPWAALYEGATKLGVKFDQENYNKFVNWCKCCVFISVPAIAVSRRPTEVHWENGVLHNETGMSVKFADGWGIWTLNGITVDEQIVLRPETQTLAQLDGETNSDVQAIRIQRFGWPRYVQEKGLEPIDQRDNVVQRSLEALYRDPKISDQIMVATCPTGRVFAMAVPVNVLKEDEATPADEDTDLKDCLEIKTCEQARNWIDGLKLNEPSRCLFRT